MEDKLLPENWDYPLLGEVAKITQGNSKLTKKIYKTDGKYVAFSGTGADGLVDEYEHEGDAIILSAVGARCGKCFRASGQWTSIANTAIIRPHLKDQTLLSYLFYLLNNENFWPKSGTGQPFVQTGAAQRETRIPLPPLAEQQRIVAKLDELMERLARARVKLERVPRLLSHFRRAVLSAACSGALTHDWREENDDVEAWGTGIEVCDEVEGLEKWRQLPFGSALSELRNGISTKPSMEPPGLPILRISATRGGKVDLGDVRFLESSEKLISTYALRDGDLLFTRYNGSLELLGVCGMVRGLGSKTLLYPDKLMRTRFNHPQILPDYVEIYFQAPDVRDKVTEKSKSSAGQNGVSGSDLKAIQVKFPPLAEQIEIVARVNRLFARADSLEARFDKAQTFFERMSGTLLAKAFRGELVPQNLNDESAAVLLERLRAASSHGDGVAASSANSKARKPRKPRVKKSEQTSLF